MNINIYFPIDKYGGGGNTFLKALKKYFENVKVYKDSPSNADVIIFNSHHKLIEIAKLKRKYPEKIFIHRIDGPVYRIRGRDLKIDKLIYHCNELLSDGTVFQSKWSKEENKKIGLKENKYSEIIMNAPNSEIFFKNDFQTKNEKTTLVTTTNSANWNKGFKFYRYLDDHLDFSKYKFYFAGNSKIKFKNIINLGYLNSLELADKLRESDIFIAASANDPCSNSLIEALHCGLPAVALKSGGHPEIIKEAGEFFENELELIEKIDKVAENIEVYRNRIKIPDMEKVGENYYNFAKKVHSALQNSSSRKKIALIDILGLILTVQVIRLQKWLKKRLSILK